MWAPGEPEPTVELRDHMVPISQVCGVLWSCDDVVASGDVDALEMVIGERPNTYGRAARRLRRCIDATCQTAGK
jgi:hypothetical protein